ncbi:CLUMA_CG006385, isoform A [Clunio marinus]|uniref:CLUMA_CG006385, isoform A n=1 Tax=Clunio marinus TaxID=568069 RepID=A0A1J1HZY2_9DIPT|nr:CLUMA_CG006385, isoform A [Clunio marinus]
MLNTKIHYKVLNYYFARKSQRIFHLTNDESNATNWCIEMTQMCSNKLKVTKNNIKLTNFPNCNLFGEVNLLTE